jgi:hypothetical protein
LNSEAGHQESPWDQVRSQLLHNVRFAAGLEEDHHVACQDNEVELGVGTRLESSEIGEIGFRPGEFWSLYAGRGEHPGVGIHANHREAASCQLDRHPSSSAARVEYADSARFAKQYLDQVCFAVDVVALSC